MNMVVLFSGHRIDDPDRTLPRFPASHAKALAQEVAAAMPKNTHVGVCSAANGGDILFLEACSTRNIPCHVIIPFLPEEFLRRSVATSAPGNWEARFNKLWSATPETLRHILTPNPNVNPYAACNDALIDQAAELGNVQVIVLWDGKGGDSLGGTADLVQKARYRGWPVKVITP